MLLAGPPKISGIFGQVAARVSLGKADAVFPYCARKLNGALDFPILLNAGLRARLPLGCRHFDDTMRPRGRRYLNDRARAPLFVRYDEIFRGRLDTRDASATLQVDSSRAAVCCEDLWSACPPNRWIIYLHSQRMLGKLFAPIGLRVSAKSETPSRVVFVRTDSRRKLRRRNSRSRVFTFGFRASTLKIAYRWQRHFSIEIVGCLLIGWLRVSLTFGVSFWERLGDSSDQDVPKS